jgi:hypothetical protein
MSKCGTGAQQTRPLPTTMTIDEDMDINMDMEYGIWMLMGRGVGMRELPNE